MLFIFLSTGTSAQVQKIHLQPGLLLKNETSVLTYANSLLPESAGKFRVSEARHSPYATYYSLEQVFDGIPIFGLQIKICVDEDGICKSVMGEYFLPEEILTSFKQKKKIIPVTLGEVYKFDTSLTGETVLYIDASGNLQEGYIYSDKKNENGFETLIVDEQDAVVFYSDHRSYFQLPDSTVTGIVFLPDPLTSANTTYGGEYADHDDSVTTGLQSQQMNVSFITDFEAGTFYLRNTYLELVDFASPIIPVVTSSTGNFIYSRTDDGFEDVNTFYHLTNFVLYCAGLGFHSLFEEYIQIDTHGAGGADQSFYVSGSPPSIQYGEGGVDDAEDADVIIHEYTHYMSDNASPGSNSGFERRAVDEGFGDYFAVSYSRSFSDFNWQNVFSWDGHNEFWSGRDANTSKHYPEDVGASLYDASEIWSGALMDMYDAIGKENTDKLVLESLYGSVLEMSMPEAALVLLNSEALLFDSLYHDAVFDILYERGLLTGVEIPSVNSTSNIQISNTYNFTFANEALHIVLPEFSECSIILTDIAGKIIYQEEFSGKEFLLKDVINESGVYILTIQTPTESLSQKIIKF